MTKAQLRPPTATDGASVHRLIGLCLPLDTNSTYCNLLQCTHFANTSVVAEVESIPIGFISGYLIPDRPDTLFVWQVAISESARGQGLATRMLNRLLERENLQQVQFIETTITQDNAASWKLFERLAEALKSPLVTETFFDKSTHFEGQHESEILVKIGPLTP